MAWPTTSGAGWPEPADNDDAPDPVLAPCGGLGVKELSLIVLEEKQEVVRLYRRHGYRVVDRRAIVPHELIPYTGDAVLMTAAV